MAVARLSGEIGAGSCVYDAAIVGASLAGCTAAILLASARARVVLVEQRPDAAAFKRICSHFIQSSAVPAMATRNITPARALAASLPRVAMISARESIAYTIWKSW